MLRNSWRLILNMHMRNGTQLTPRKDREFNAALGLDSEI